MLSKNLFNIEYRGIGMGKYWMLIYSSWTIPAYCKNGPILHSQQSLRLVHKLFDVLLTISISKNLWFSTPRKMICFDNVKKQTLSAKPRWWMQIVLVFFCQNISEGEPVIHLHLALKIWKKKRISNLFFYLYFEKKLEIIKQKRNVAYGWEVNKKIIMK